MILIYYNETMAAKVPLAKRNASFVVVCWNITAVFGDGERQGDLSKSPTRAIYTIAYPAPSCGEYSPESDAEPTFSGAPLHAFSSAPPPAPFFTVIVSHHSPHRAHQVEYIVEFGYRLGQSPYCPGRGKLV